MNEAPSHINTPEAPMPNREAPISASELAHILAALTFWRQCRMGDAENRPPLIHQIATQGGTLPTLSDERVQLLLDRLDGAEVITVGLTPTRLVGLYCSVCREPQFATPSGATCPNGHGGAQGIPGIKPTKAAEHVVVSFTERLMDAQERAVVGFDE